MLDVSTELVQPDEQNAEKNIIFNENFSHILSLIKYPLKAVLLYFEYYRNTICSNLTGKN